MHIKLHTYLIIDIHPQLFVSKIGFGLGGQTQYYINQITYPNINEKLGQLVFKELLEFKYT